MVTHDHNPLFGSAISLRHSGPSALKCQYGHVAHADQASPGNTVPLDFGSDNSHALQVLGRSRRPHASIEQIKAANYNLDQKNPHAADVISHDPEALLADYTRLQMEAQALRDQLKAILAESLSGARA